MRRLGSQGPEISLVGYGAWEAGGRMWGSPRDDRTVIEAIQAAVDAGMNWIDTAEVYGGGRSEELVAEAIQGRRDRVMVFTKVAPSVSGIHPQGIRTAVQQCLRRLRTDRIDLFQIHGPDRDVPLEDSWAAMAELVDEGLVRWIGVSNFGRRLVERCLTIRHVDSVQNQFSLLHRDDADGLLPWLAERGVGYLAYGPLAFGLLTGAIGPDTEFEESDWRSGRRHQVGYYDDLFAPGRFEENLQRVERLKGIAGRLEVSVPELALRAALDHPGMTGVIAGSVNAGHVRANARAGDLRLEPADLAEVLRAVASGADREPG